MPKTVYQSCVECLEQVDGEINLDDLSSLIMIHIGGNERTITQALHVMAATGLIKDIGNARFEVIKK